MLDPVLTQVEDLNNSQRRPFKPVALLSLDHPGLQPRIPNATHTQRDWSQLWRPMKCRKGTVLFKLCNRRFAGSASRMSSWKHKLRATESPGVFPRFPGLAIAMATRARAKRPICQADRSCNEIPSELLCVLL